MVDKKVGTAGTLRITDDGTRVRFYVLCSDPATNTGGYRWYGTVNGTSVGGTVTLNSGFGSRLLGEWVVSASQTVTLGQQATGTQGLGGAASVSMSITRGSAPGAPGKPGVSAVDGDQASISWSASSGSVSDYGVYVSEYSDYRTYVFAQWVGTSRSYRLPAGTLSAGKRYFVRVRARNFSNGEMIGAYSASTEFWTVPNAPTGLSVSRVSDTQHALSWSGAAHEVQRSTNGGAWQTVASLSGASSWTDSGTKGNSKYTWRVRAKAGTQASSWSNSVTVYTTPATPTGASATRSGSNIIVDASGKPPYATSYDVRDGSATVATGVSLPWTHVNPSVSTTHQYTIRAKIGSLTSGWSSATPVVQLPAPPNAPTNLAPNGGVSKFGQPVRFSWRHNPVDSSAQTAFEVWGRLVGGLLAFRLLGSGTTAQQADITLTDDNGFPTTGDFEWQVRTKGVHANWSPFSSVATVSVIDPPGVAILSPDGVWDSAVLSVDWSFFQAQGWPQSAWQMELLDDTMTVVDRRSGSGATTTASPAVRLTEGTWTVRVRAAAGGIWSEWAEVTFTADFVPPAPPMITGQWVEADGGVDLQAVPGGIAGPVDPDALLSGGRVILWDAIPDTSQMEVVGSDAPATTSLLIERLQDGEWVQVISTGSYLAPGGNPSAVRVMDWESVSYGDIVYKATSFTADGATASTEIIVPARSPAVWLSGGPGFTITARLVEDPQVAITTSRARALKAFAGRPKPVTVSGEALQRVVTLSGSTSDLDGDQASHEALMRLSQVPEALFLFRDPDGHRIFGELSPMQLTRQGSEWHEDGWNSLWAWAVTLTEAEEE